MTPSVHQPGQGAAFAVSLDDRFDGPLDLLLHLIRKAEIDILDIPVAQLTAAYLGALDQMQQLEIEPASEFLLMAATLLQIKSRMLLPRPALDDLPEGLDDPRTDLVHQLLVYQQFRLAAQTLAERPRLNRDVFGRPNGQDRPPSDADDPLADHDIWRLAEAFRRLVVRGRFEHPHDIYVERISIAERIAQIADTLAANGPMPFSALTGETPHREEAITTFLALLEMTRLKLIRVEQTDRLGPVRVEARVGAIGPMGEAAAGTLLG